MKKQVELKEGTLVIVCEGLKKVEKGPFAGETTLGSLKVYLGTEQVGLLQSFKLEAHVNEALPHLEFNFGHALPEGEQPVLDRLRASYERSIEKIRKFFPWSKWVSPIGSSPPPQGPEEHGRA